MSSKKTINNYYVIKFEKYLELMQEIEKKYNILADILHDEMLKTLPEFWSESPIHALMECIVTIIDIKKFLDDKINNVPEEVVKLAQENNIKDVLINKEELKTMNVLLLAAEELEKRLEVEQKIFITTH